MIDLERKSLTLKRIIVAKTKKIIINSVLLHGTLATKQSLFNSIKKPVLLHGT
jgi:hypothetical protein